jgi:DNA-binding NarL/FixJ family response regulator
VSIRIIIADDHQIVRQGLRVLLEKEPDMQVVGEAEDGPSTVRMAKELAPHVILMDIKMPVLNGIEATRQILTDLPDVKIIALSMYPDQRFVTNMLRSGARGYVLKDCAFEELIQAIRMVVANKTYLCPSVTEVVVKDYVNLNPSPNQNSFAVLTAREREVLRLLTEGRRTSQIAQLLEISVKTVDTHRQQIIHKLGIRSLAELTKYAIREGLTSLEL